ncbi:MAG: phosphate acyltransferase PlsX [Christensenellales bacterium]|jgi:glycerol-3-phosphate acyltransferase PlsX|nr:phosphate acyltransferase PlsX [Eubacteriales bacterium]
MKIVVDAYGSDLGAEAVAEGAALALKRAGGFSVVLAGKKEELEALFDKYGGDRMRAEFLDAPDAVTNDDVPTTAIRTKPNSSLAKGLELLASDSAAAAFVSAGSTGAVLTAAFLKVGRLKNIMRPALAPLLPTVTGGSVVMTDCGANVDCKPQYLAQFALMGAAFAEASGIKNPKVGLLSNGTEDKKGNELTKEAFGLISSAGLNFIGNVEGRDILTGAVDVVVADGFYGNIALKTAEGVAGAVFGLLKEGIKQGGLRAKLGALLLKPVLYGIKSKLDYNERGGACFLGLKKVVIKAHGASKASSIAAAILQAKELAQANIAENIENRLASYSSAE